MRCSVRNYNANSDPVEYCRLIAYNIKTVKRPMAVSWWIYAFKNLGSHYTLLAHVSKGIKGFPKGVCICTLPPTLIIGGGNEEKKSFLKKNLFKLDVRCPTSATLIRAGSQTAAGPVSQSVSQSVRQSFSQGSEPEPIVYALQCLLGGNVFINECII